MIFFLCLSRLEASFYVEDIEPSILESRNLTVVDNPQEANYALLSLAAPFKPTTASGLAASIRNGLIEFNNTERTRQAKIYATVTTVVDMKFNRPAAVPGIADNSAALLGIYGSSHEVFLDVLFGIDGWAPKEKLPFDLPRSMAAAVSSKEDVPFDTTDPLFRFGLGLEYTKAYKEDHSNR